MLFLTAIVPSEQEPVTVYTPAALITSSVPSMEKPLALSSDAVTPESVNVNVTVLSGFSNSSAVSLSANTVAGSKPSNNARVVKIDTAIFPYRCLIHMKVPPFYR